MPDRRGVLELSLDGRRLNAREGQTVLQVAREHGVPIPTLCFLEGLSTWGSCRICMVEVGPQRVLRPACATPVVEDMEIRTESPRLRAHRRMILEMLFAEGNHVCAVCVANEHCELQSAAAQAGMDHVRLEYAAPQRTVDATHDRYVFDPNRCILCTRCVRVCDEVEGAHVWDIAGRGESAHLIADMNVSWGQAGSCTDCGKCVTVCPTGALFVRGTSTGEVRRAPDVVVRLTTARREHQWLPAGEGQ
ncbi:MAG: bidirectional [NiFe] hydrogenase diaphorase subunit [Actinomycetota bacterium]|nr:bidirectional [NiFe] hydrogenase diaphorase subunit [Actinomycetota bacterium]